MTKPNTEILRVENSPIDLVLALDALHGQDRAGQVELLRDSAETLALIFSLAAEATTKR